jgi:hypothetical protein
MSQTLQKEEKKEKKPKIIKEIQFEFDETGCYYAYQFFKALGNFTDETEITLKHNEMQIRFMDASRIMLAQLSKTIDYDCENTEKTLKTYAVNIDDLVNLLKVRKRKNNKNLKLVFYDNNSYTMDIVKYNYESGKRLTKSLKLIDIDLEEIPMDNLLQIEYPSSFTLTHSQFEDVIYEVGDYADIVKIVNNRDRVIFSQSGQIGEMEYPFTRSQLVDHNCNEKQKGAYSLSFLKGLKPFFKFETNLEFQLKTDHPLRITMFFEEVGFSLDYFLAPRVEEVSYEDDDIDDEFEF